MLWDLKWKLKTLVYFQIYSIYGLRLEFGFLLVRCDGGKKQEKSEVLKSQEVETGVLAAQPHCK